MGMTGALAAVIVIGLVVSMLPQGSLGRIAGVPLEALRIPRGRTRERELIEGIATWSEMLRDTLGASSGLEQALIATAGRAPTLLEEPLQRMVATMRYGTTEDALREFAETVDHAVCDFVVAALITASRGSVRDLGALLGRLSESTRDESAVHLRVWVSRARSRTSVRIIAGSVGTFIVGLAVSNPGYLAPYGTVEGGLVLAIIAVTFAMAWVAMIRMAESSVSVRFVTARRQR